MRIISGSKRGKKLAALEGGKVRPTTDRVKESLFNILQFNISGSSFVDLFAGSGQIGLEALSRGADRGYFVESSREAAGLIRQNILSTGFEDRAELFMGDYKSFFRQKQQESFDIIYIDPPYYENMFLSAAELSSMYVKPAGLIICEHPTTEELPQRIGEAIAGKSYRYGKIELTIYSRSPGLTESV